MKGNQEEREKQAANGEMKENGEEKLGKKFSAHLEAVRRMAAMIVGRPFGTVEEVSTATPMFDHTSVGVETPKFEGRGSVGVEIVLPAGTSVEPDRTEGRRIGNEPEMKSADDIPEVEKEPVADPDGIIPQEKADMDGSSSEDEDSDEEEDEEDGSSSEEILDTDDSISRTVDWLMEVESEAADAQEALEDESLLRVREDVKVELAESEKLSGAELERAVDREMAAYTAAWEDHLSELELESAKLQERVVEGGVSLPDLYKAIEKQAPQECVTEAWKKRAHWTGTEASEDFVEVLHSAEKDLELQRPVMRRRGKLVEEGASGFLEQKFKEVDNGNGEVHWDLLDELVEPNPSSSGTSLFGSKEWASVYAASTPEQASRLGLKFRGVDEVEEIQDINQRSGLEAMALAQESEFGLTEQQKNKLKRVHDHDDIRRMLSKSTQKRNRQHSNQEIESSDNRRRPELIVLSDDEDDVPYLKTLKIEDSAVLEDTTSMLKLQKRNIESGSSDRSKKRRKIVIDDDEDDNEGSALKQEAETSHDGNTSEKLEEEEKHSEHQASCLPKLTSTRGNKYFNCTVCGKGLASIDVLVHPAFRVIICKPCRQAYERISFTKDDDGSEAQCKWCAEGGDMFCCDHCDKVFCERCLKRNFGTRITKTLDSYPTWKCFLCDPGQLKELSERLKEAEDEADMDQYVTSNKKDFEIAQTRTKRRKNIRRMMSDDELSEATKAILALEKERRERVKKWYDAANKDKSLYAKSQRAPKEDEEKHLCVGDCKALGCVINIGSNEELVRIPLSISKCLKPHQLSGVRFMWENCIESVSKVLSGCKGLGCILAHTMGLGKTLEVIAFLYTVMRSVDLGFKTVLIVVPVNVLHNWRSEFKKWRPQEVEHLPVHMLEDVNKDYAARANHLRKWKQNGGVMLIGYAAFRILSLGKNVREEETRSLFRECLQDPGPDLLVCDEAHTIKNKKADITLELQQVRSLRRIALTGSPLQNNLMEYYCMVNFVREGFLGKVHEFRNRFQNPIANGQHADSTTADVKKMKQCAHVLHSRLEGFVQRKDTRVLQFELPPKCVWVINVRMSALQKELLKKYISICRGRLFDHYHFLAKIWNHPDLLFLAKDEKNAQSFVVESDKEDEAEEGAVKLKGETKPIPEADNFEWCQEILNGAERQVLENGGKLVLVLRLISMSSAQGDKTLVFSQSLHTLDLIEDFLERTPRSTGTGVWTRGKDWYRLDGSTSPLKRQQIADHFNDPNNTDVKCVLVSTKAGSLGINLTGASRVVIVDGSWNPTHDIQALFRSWRLGQTKPVYVYRLLAHRTMEEKIYHRQLHKEGIAARVLDAHQVGRHLNADDLDLELLSFDDDEEVPDDAAQQATEAAAAEPSSRARKSKHKSFCAPSDAPPRDELMAMLLLDYRPRWIAGYHEHEPLLEDLEAEKLTSEDKAQAWEAFRKEHEPQPVPQISSPAVEALRISFQSSGGQAGGAVVPVLPQTTSIQQQQQQPVPVLAQTPSLVRPQQQQQPIPVLAQTPSLVRPQQQQQPVPVLPCDNKRHLALLSSLRLPIGGYMTCSKCSLKLGWEHIKPV